MKCLSLWQPWASLLVGDAKRVETRGRPIRHRGPLLIHAAKKWNNELRDLCKTPEFANALTELGITEFPDLPFGAIVGRVDVIDCFPTERVEVGGKYADPFGFIKRPARQVSTSPLDDHKLLIDEAERAFGDYSPGRFAFLCENPVRFDKPIPFRGAQGLFNVPEELL